MGNVMQESPIEEFEIEEFEETLKKGNEQKLEELEKLKKGFEVQMELFEKAKSKLKTKEEKEEPLVKLKSFLIKLEDDNKIKRIEDLLTITDKISYIESLLEKESSEEQTEKLKIVLGLLENIKYNKSI